MMVIIKIFDEKFLLVANNLGFTKLKWCPPPPIIIRFFSNMKGYLSNV